jgi:hypothetical protein
MLLQAISWCTLKSVTRTGQIGQPESGSWKASSSRFTIEYALDVLEEIRAFAQDGFQRIPHGGIEEGGVLYGRLEGETVRILEWRRIASDHAAGPSFLLSEADTGKLSEQMANPDAELGDLIPVGWCASHSRSSLELKPSDIELHRAMFPESWQAILLVKTSKEGTTQGAFFVRSDDGDLSASPAEAPLEIRPNPSLLLSKRATAAKAAPESDPRSARRGLPARVPASIPLPPPRPIPAPAATEASHVSVAEIPVPAFAVAQAPRSRRMMGRVLFIAALCALGAGAVIAVPRLLPAEKAALALQATELRGATAHQLHLKWELNAPAFRDAERASMEIIDGSTTKMIELDSDEIQRGSLTYVRQSGDVQVRMTVFRRTEKPVQELARYIGPAVDAPQTAAVPASDKSESDRLAAETEKLRQVLRQEQAKTKRLEESVATIKSRLERENVRNP